MASVLAPPATHAFLAGGGAIGLLVGSRDWSATPLGPIEEWSSSLKTAVNIMLTSSSPVSILWGPERIQLYNDAYVPIAAERHPDALGRSAARNWSEAYETFLGPLLDRVFEGETVRIDEHAVLLRKSLGLVEQRFFTGSFQPVRDETGRVKGVFHPLSEVTGNQAAARISAGPSRRCGTARSATGRSSRAPRTTRSYASTIAGSSRRGTPARSVSRGSPSAMRSGSRATILFTPEDRASGRADDELSRAERDGRAQNERWHMRKDGSRFWASGLMMRLDADGGSYLNMFRDRTAEHEAEAALAAEVAALGRLAGGQHAAGRRRGARKRSTTRS